MSNNLIELNGYSFKAKPYAFFRSSGLDDVENMLKPNQYLFGTLTCTNVLAEGLLNYQCIVDYTDGTSDFVGVNFRTSNSFENLLFNKLKSPFPIYSVHFNGVILTLQGDEFVSVFKDVEPVPAMKPPPRPEA